MSVLETVFNIGAGITLVSALAAVILIYVSIAGGLIGAPWYKTAGEFTDLAMYVSIVSGATTLAALLIGDLVVSRRSRSRQSGG